MRQASHDKTDARNRLNPAGAAAFQARFDIELQHCPHCGNGGLEVIAASCGLCPALARAAGP
jgi:hypothetical protein